MDSSPDRLEERESAIHGLLGGGIVADVILWRRREVTVGILLATLFALVVFEFSGYTLLSLVSNVLLLLLLILFVWAKAAGILNRPPPPIPKLQLSEEMMIEISAFVRSHFNEFFSVAYDVALGKDLKLFYKVSVWLWVISVVGRCTDFITLTYTGLAIVLTLPAMYERYEYHIVEYGMDAYEEMQQVCVRVDITLSKLRRWIALKIQKMKTC